MKKLIIDNYDSFTYNIFHLVGGADIIRNDELSLEEIKARNYTHIIISPGPGSVTDPKYFGVCNDVIEQLGKTVPVLGICLGMQGIWHCFGGRVIPAALKRHGKTSTVTHTGKGIFLGIPQHINVMRYHSLVADPSQMPPLLEVTARTDDGVEIMGIQHSLYPIYGVQFHPESFATEYGKKIIDNFLRT